MRRSTAAREGRLETWERARRFRCPACMAHPDENCAKAGRAGEYSTTIIHDERWRLAEVAERIRERRASR